MADNCAIAFLSPTVNLLILRILLRQEYNNFFVASQNNLVSSGEKRPFSIGLNRSTTNLLNTVKLRGCSWWILAYSIHWASVTFLASKPRCALCWRRRTSAGADHRPLQQYFSIFSVSNSYNNSTLIRCLCSWAATNALCSALKANLSFTTPRLFGLFLFSREYHIVWPVVGISCKMQIKINWLKLLLFLNFLNNF